MAAYGEVVKELRATFATGKTRNYEWRIAQLKALIKMLDENNSIISDALSSDLHKHKSEGQVMEIGMSINDAVDAINNLKDWMKPEKVACLAGLAGINLAQWGQGHNIQGKVVQVSKGALYMMDTATIVKEPLGVALIIGAWNYPIQLVFLPLIGAISAGNCAIIKPSEMSAACAKFLEDYLPKYLDQDCFRVINGGVPETTALLKEKFDFIFYTGNSNVGKIVMRAAAEYLTPVILELGGKSPVYVDKDTDLRVVARRICWGKFCNSGQTCIAPDYVMCPKEIQDELIENVKGAIEEFYTKDPKSSDSYGRIVNERHFQRIQKLKKGGVAAVDGEDDEKEKYIAPTVFRDVQLSDPIMQEEIFGPLMPVVPVTDHLAAIDIINQREKPLSLYLFTNKKKLIADFKEKTSSGAVLVNDTVLHAGLPTLPFGGVGNSGMGAYHGKFSFDAFSHNKPVLERGLGMEQVNALRYPPYSEKKLDWMNWIMRKKVKKPGFFGLFPFIVMAAMFSMFFKTMGVAADSVRGNRQ